MSGNASVTHCAAQVFLSVMQMNFWHLVADSHGFGMWLVLFDCQHCFCRLNGEELSSLLILTSVVLCFCGYVYVVNSREFQWLKFLQTDDRWKCFVSFLSAFLHHM